MRLPKIGGALYDLRGIFTMFSKSFIWLLLILLQVVLSGCSSNIASEKQAEGLGRPKILEEDITPGSGSPVTSPASSPVISPGFEKPTTGVSGAQPPIPSGDQSSPGRTPRRFQWKDTN